MKIAQQANLTQGAIRQDRLRTAAQELETTFLAEMLKAAGVGKTQEGLGGGFAEQQFSSFLVTEHARALTANGGIGLANGFYTALKEMDNAR